MSSHTARERILSRLKASGTHQTEVPEASLPPQLSLDREARIERLTELMTAIRTEVHIVDADSWIEKLKALAREKGWKRMLYGPGASIGSAIENAWAADSQDLPDLMAYTEPVETFKDDLFHLDAGITTTRGAVADSGAVVLWPTVQEPRLMSLVPAVHVAVLDATRFTIH
jgi:L-lactate dehydrogenase complex protein LldG